ncbi:hypothetical protein CKF54_04640 [Psittacicella hinzii]|uniref:DNA-directed DNA polymerase n=1 Tax=Psittacicella hinzii TaxID=2028575 RepID=A0A3A1Y2I1_9GAMM|nr:exonuclease domain-containing protein [Psittacicella hinzii]RIY32532.1 hypothetical protein CKF54_04640 [Psittacicella hinzii]
MSENAQKEEKTLEEKPKSSFSLDEIANFAARAPISSASMYLSDLDPEEDDEDDEDFAGENQESALEFSSQDQHLSVQADSEAELQGGLQGNSQANGQADSQGAQLEQASPRQVSSSLSQNAEPEMAQAGSSESSNFANAGLANAGANLANADLANAGVAGADFAEVDFATQVPGSLSVSEEDVFNQVPLEAQADFSAMQGSDSRRGEEFVPGAMVGGAYYGGENGLEIPVAEQEVARPFDYQVYRHFYQPDVENSLSPPINFSQNEEEYQAKRTIVSARGNFEESEYPLTRFEVELYYDYPDLTPDPEDESFCKNSLAWAKLVHHLKFDCYFMDTETTGMTKEAGKQPSEGHRIITLGMVPMLNDHLNIQDVASMVDEVFNPEGVEIEYEAYKVHGFKNKDLVDAPVFKSFAERFVRMVMGKVLIIHNAPFDLSFLNMELKRAGYPFEVEDICLVIDSLVLARSIYHGRASLDALSERFEVNIERELHGALLDSIILADVYTRMLNSLQEEWYIDPNKGFRSPIIWNFEDKDTPPLDPELVRQINALEVTLSEEELERHEKFCADFNITDSYNLKSKAKMIEMQKALEAAKAAEEEESDELEDVESYQQETQELEAQAQ